MWWWGVGAKLWPYTRARTPSSILWKILRYGPSLLRD
jgi:hypothetical protein